MIDVLKKIIEEKIIRPVKTRGDCELISNAILETLDLDISSVRLKDFMVCLQAQVRTKKR